jgi:hypothetical protein
VPSRVQTIRSNVAGNRPSGRAPGELYANWPDKQLGVIDSAGNPLDLISVRYFSTLTAYVVGDHVFQAGCIYRAKGSVAAGAFNPVQWDQLATGADTAAYLPLAGGTMTGPLVLAADPAAALQSATKQYVDGGRLGDNRIINGDMRIDQRNNGAGGIAVGYTVDRWQFNTSLAGKITWQRGGPSAALLTATGFGYDIALTTTVSYTAGATDTFYLHQPVEADMMTDFMWGTASAQPVTISFWAASTLAGTFGGSIRGNGATRSYPFIYVLPGGNVWTKCSVTIPGDTGGTWVTTGNTAGLFLGFDLGTGATYRGPAGAWASANYIGATGTVSVVGGVNGSFLCITGVKLEIGSVATPFNRQSTAKALLDCQRYFVNNSAFNASFWSGMATASGSYFSTAIFPVAMRAYPTVTLMNGNGSGFPTAAGTAVNIYTYGFNESRVASATSSGGAYFSAGYTANAEL